ncbi:hypothetical protein QI633_17535 [Nocardioides sp. QY071]|uniref:hypothetical protein n=1 Tax=Nocardioides sp. QY071 TaxID=3044187 RepID=UPI00249B4988|nr:hypothetical protein [Nocardioides sp. QY071]WGY04858.1 hypothetical protein QI633_17535 [Nocardioides sp. QY071]
MSTLASGPEDVGTQDGAIAHDDGNVLLVGEIGHEREPLDSVRVLALVVLHEGFS